MSVIRECSNPECTFRYPDQSDHPIAYCPKCGSAAPITLTIPQNDAPEAENISQNSAIRLKVILDNLRSIYNVGSIFRTSDGFGIEELLLCGITPTPDNPRFSKTSLGAEQTVPWSYHPNTVSLCKSIKNNGFQVISVEKTSISSNLYAIDSEILASPTAIVFGNEVTGIDPEVMHLSDKTLYIPMLGRKSSYNVSIAFGIAVSYLYALSIS